MKINVLKSSETVVNYGWSKVVTMSESKCDVAWWLGSWDWTMSSGVVCSDSSGLMTDVDETIMMKSETRTRRSLTTCDDLLVSTSPATADSCSTPTSTYASRPADPTNSSCVVLSRSGPDSQHFLSWTLAWDFLKKNLGKFLIEGLRERTEYVPQL